MAVKFALPSSGAAAISPSSHSSWERDCDDFSRKKAVLWANRTGTSMSTVGDNSNVSGIQDTCGYQWVYGPIAAGTISGTCDVQMRGRDAIFVNLYLATCAIWIAKPDGTVRGTLTGATQNDSTNWNTTMATYAWSVTCSSVTATAGDYLVMEQGWSDDVFTDFSRGEMQIGDTDDNIFFEFSDNDIVFWAPAGLTYSNSGQRVKRGTAMTNMSPSSTGGPITTYAIQTGALPAGVTINSGTGVISGTPTANGSYTWTVRATGPEGQTTDSASLTMTVFAGNNLDMFQLMTTEINL